MRQFLVVESGSTKTQWIVVNGSEVGLIIKSNGLNASYMSSDDIIKNVQDSVDQDFRNASYDSIYFYGAGCSGEVRISKVENALKKCFQNSGEVLVRNDLYASAHALLGEDSGLVGILGTGSNMCYFDGKEIIQKYTSFGYLIGDEGGGVSLGKMLLKGYLRKEFEEDLLKRFYSDYKMTDDQLVVEMYKSIQPNKWLASFTPFLSKYRKHPEISALLSKAFDAFFSNLVEPYEYTGINTLNLSGSIAAVFQPEIETSALKHGYQLGTVLKEPLNQLIDFHIKTR